jgi:hypothetical protein
LEDYKKTLVATTNTPAIEARARDMGEIVFSAIWARVRRDVERKCEDRNRERKKNRKFKVGEWVMKKKNGLVGRVQALWKGLYLIISKNKESKGYWLQDETKEEYF